MIFGPEPDLGHEWVQIAPGARRCVRCRLRDADPSASYPCTAERPPSRFTRLTEW